MSQFFLEKIDVFLGKMWYLTEDSPPELTQNAAALKTAFTDNIRFRWS